VVLLQKITCNLNLRHAIGLRHPIPFAFSRDPYGVFVFQKPRDNSKTRGNRDLTLAAYSFKILTKSFFFPDKNSGTTPKPEDTATHTATLSATHSATHTKESGSTG